MPRFRFLPLVYFLTMCAWRYYARTHTHIVEDTLNHLQNIRESVVQMKNASSLSHHNHHHHHHHHHPHLYMASGLINPAVSRVNLKTRQISEFECYIVHSKTKYVYTNHEYFNLTKLELCPFLSPHYHSSIKLNTQKLSASRLFSSCPSLPDLTAATSNGIWPTQQTIGLNNDRRKSWTAIEDLTIDCGKSSHKR